MIKSNIKSEKSEFDYERSLENRRRMVVTGAFGKRRKPLEHSCKRVYLLILSFRYFELN